MRHRLSIHREDNLLLESTADEIRLGRGSGNDIQLATPGIAAHQGMFRWTREGYLYVDLGHAVSLLVRGETRRAINRRPGRKILVSDGDRLVLGGSEQPVTLQVGISEMEPEPAPRAITFGASLHQIDRIEQRVEHDAAALACIYHVVRELASVRTRQELFRALCGSILRHSASATHVTVYTSDDEGNFGTAIALDRTGPSTVAEPLSRKVLGHMEEKEEAVLFMVGETNFELSASLTALNIRSGICVPLRCQHRIVGVLQVDCREMGRAPFHQRDLELMTLIGNQASIVLTNLEMVASMERMNVQLIDALKRVEMLSKAKEYLGKFVPLAIRRRVDTPPEELDQSVVATAATILFLDIGGYTRLTEALSQLEVGRLVETYFSAYIDAIQENGGDVNETAGDGLMIIFRASDASDHAHAAVRTAIAVRRETRRVNGEIEGFDPIDVNVGIETGHVTVGSRKIQGLAGTRWTYTATGMVTNLAARVAAHATAGQVFLGPAAAAKVGEAFNLREGGEVQFKNVSRPVRVFELLDGLDEA